MAKENTNESALVGLAIMGILALFSGIRRALGFLTTFLLVGGAVAFLICGTGRDAQGVPVRNDPYLMVRLGAGLAWIGAIMTFAYWAGSHIVESVSTTVASKLRNVD